MSPGVKRESSLPMSGLGPLSNDGTAPISRERLDALERALERRYPGIEVICERFGYADDSEGLGRSSRRGQLRRRPRRVWQGVPPACIALEL